MTNALTSKAVLFESPGRVSLKDVSIAKPCPGDVIVDIECTGISTGTEKLLWQGTMPAFPGLGYPLVPGYEAVGRIASIEHTVEPQDLKVGDRVFIPGASCYEGNVKGLFGASAAQLVVPSHRATAIGELPADQSTLFALAATAMHILTHQDYYQHYNQRSNQHKTTDASAPIRFSELALRTPELIVGHGTLGRLLARICVAIGAEPPTVWESNPDRRTGNVGYDVIAQEDDARFDYNRVCDVSGCVDLFDLLIARLKKGGELTLGGFYSKNINFAFPAAFMRELQLSIAAEWKPEDLLLTHSLVASGALSLDGLITHSASIANVDDAYNQAFEDSTCLKMILNWREQ